MIFYTGFADEAGSGLDAQIRATCELGWNHIESRNIDGINIHNLSDDKFEVAAAKLAAAGIKVNCFGSEIANWGKDPFKEEDFQNSMAMLQRALPRMKRLGTSMLRGMSFAMQKTRSPFDREVEEQVFRKVGALVNVCAEAGIIYGHENCMNFGGQSWEHTLKLFDRIRSPYFKLIFDTGNPVFTDLRLGTPPYRKQSAWEFYCNIREFIYYVHIKDARFVAETDGIFPKATFTWPGEGDGEVRRIVADLLHHGYDGGFSIEPHIASVFHETDPARDLEKVKYDSYVEYGRRFMKIVDDARSAIS